MSNVIQMHFASQCLFRCFVMGICCSVEEMSQLQIEWFLFTYFVVLNWDLLCSKRNTCLDYTLYGFLTGHCRGPSHVQPPGGVCDGIRLQRHSAGVSQQPRTAENTPAGLEGPSGNTLQVIQELTLNLSFCHFYSIVWIKILNTSFMHVV